MGQCDWPVPVAAVAHSCVGTWWDAVRGGRVAPDYAWRARATSDGLRRADAIAAPSHAFAEALHRVHGVDGLTVVYNGRDPLHLPGVPRARAVLTAGRLWDDAKNARMLDAVAARLSAPLRAAGPTEGPGGAQVALQHTVLLGKLDEPAMGDALARASVFASAALYEPFGLAVLEAAQAGLALVLSDIPTFRELWHGAAVFVPPGGVDAWVAALGQMLAAPAAGEVADYMDEGEALGDDGVQQGSTHNNRPVRTEAARGQGPKTREANREMTRSGSSDQGTH